MSARVKRLDRRHLQRHALRAIAGRLGYPAPWALLGVERDGGDVLLRVDSGGNSLAVEDRLAGYGYLTASEPNPGGYGMAVRVRRGGDGS